MTLAGGGFAALPADHDHRFGHSKAEALVALVQIVLITCRRVDRLSLGRRWWGSGDGGGELASGSRVAMAAKILSFFTSGSHCANGSVAIATTASITSRTCCSNGSVIVALVSTVLGLVGAMRCIGC